LRRDDQRAQPVEVNNDCPAALAQTEKDVKSAIPRSKIHLSDGACATVTAFRNASGNREAEQLARVMSKMPRKVIPWGRAFGIGAQFRLSRLGWFGKWVIGPRNDNVTINLVCSIRDRDHGPDDRPHRACRDGKRGALERAHLP